MRTSIDYIKRKFTDDNILFYIADSRVNIDLNSSNRDAGGDLIDFMKNMHHIYGLSIYNKNILLHVVEIYIKGKYIIFHIVPNDSSNLCQYNINEPVCCMIHRLLFNVTYETINDHDAMLNVYKILNNINHQLFLYYIEGNDLHNCLMLFRQYAKIIKKYLNSNNKNILIKDISDIFNKSYSW